MHGVPLAGQQQFGRSLAPAQSCLRGGWQGGERVSIPPSRLCWPHTHCPPPVNREVKFGALWGSGVPGP